jgi:hypothetical protein
MNPLLNVGIGGIIETVGKVADDLFTSDEERLKAELDSFNSETARLQGQTDVNKIEAASSSVFVAGWRPAVGWVGVSGMAYQFILYPFLVWIWVYAQSQGYIPTTFNAPPQIDTDTLYVLLFGILGLGGARTFEKMKGVSKG